MPQTGDEKSTKPINVIDDDLIYRRSRGCPSPLKKAHEGESMHACTDVRIRVCMYGSIDRSIDGSKRDKLRERERKKREITFTLITYLFLACESSTL